MLAGDKSTAVCFVDRSHIVISLMFDMVLVCTILIVPDRRSLSCPKWDVRY